METYRGFPAQPLEKPVLMTVGNFDGVHRGHQALIAELVQHARQVNALSGVLTFEPHPLTVLRPDVSIPRLTSDVERSDLLAVLGLDFLLVLPFTRETAATSAADFMYRLTERLPISELWIGPDFTLGRDREGHAEHLSELGNKLGYRVRVVPPFDWSGAHVRSSRIRSLLRDDGAVDSAGGLLGRPYRVSGTVVEGASRGRQLGFPTANLALPPERLVPAFGVYACWAWIGDRGYGAVVNIGVRPSFDNGAPSVEAHLLDFNGDLYGQELGLSFVRRLRGEMRFANVADLVHQIRQDARAARRLLAVPPNDLNDAPSSWRELAHTADLAITVEAPELGALFVQAASAMYAIQGVHREAPITLARSFAIEGDGLAELLIAWLNRLLLAQDLHGEMYARFELHELSDRGLRAVAFGHPGSARRTAVKAATYHDVRVTGQPGAWQTTVTFDV